MPFQDYFPVWNKLESAQQERLLRGLVARNVEKGATLHGGNRDCTGLLVVESGQLRVFLLSDEGREVTLYRLFERDICLLSASCIIHSIQFDVTIMAEKDTRLWVIPTEVYKDVMAASAPLANFTNELIATRFTDVMWLIEQIMWKSLDKRLAAFLLEEAAIDGGDVLKITHEAIANHLGSHREVITRMLRYFQSEGLVGLSRGMVTILDQARLRALVEAGA